MRLISLGMLSAMHLLWRLECVLAVWILASQCNPQLITCWDISWRRRLNVSARTHRHTCSPSDVMMFSLQELSDLPLEMSEIVLMRTFLMLYSSDVDDHDDDDEYPVKSGKSSSSERRAFTLLSSVCWCWRRALCGWPQSPTRHWVKHQLRKLIEREYLLYVYDTI